MSKLMPRKEVLEMTLLLEVLGKNSRQQKGWWPGWEDHGGCLKENPKGTECWCQLEGSMSVLKCSRDWSLCMGLCFEYL